MTGALPDTPCWMNTWALARYERAPGLRHQFYRVNTQLFVKDADMDQAADIATASWLEWMSVRSVSRPHTAPTLAALLTGPALLGGELRMISLVVQT